MKRTRKSEAAETKVRIPQRAVLDVGDRVEGAGRRLWMGTQARAEGHGTTWHLGWTSR